MKGFVTKDTAGCYNVLVWDDIDQKYTFYDQSLTELTVAVDQLRELKADPIYNPTLEAWMSSPMPDRGTTPRATHH